VIYAAKEGKLLKAVTRQNQGNYSVADVLSQATFVVSGQQGTMQA
jgi:hypothetical protein